MKPRLAILWLVLTTSSYCMGQTADNLVLQGRAFLAAKNLTNANSRFAVAVLMSPDHQTANALYAATRLLSLPYRQPAQDMMDRLGVSLTNRDIYKWTAKLPNDTNGVPVPPNDFNAMEAVAFIRTNALPEVTRALGNLAKVTDTNFILNLTSNETKVVQVILDYGDIQMLRALLHTAEFFIYTINSYNVSAQLNALYNLHARGELTIDHLLANYPRALTFATTNDLQAAKNAFQNAVDKYLAASNLIRSRSTNVVRLFNYDREVATSESHFRQTLIELKGSLGGPVTLTYVTNKTNHLRVDLGRAFDGSVPVRSMLPNFRDGGILLGSLPDPTLQGIVFGLSESDIYSFLASHLKLKLLPNFRIVRHFTNGRLQMDLNVAEGRNYAIEASTNLTIWVEIATGASTNGILTFTDPDAAKLPKRFYRARDLSEFVSFDGVVLDGSTGKPISGAVVASSLDSHTALTDSNGHFFLQTRKASRVVGFYSITAKADGYAAAQIQGFYSKDNRLAGLIIKALAPPGMKTQPQDQTVDAGGTATFSVIAVGSQPLIYQWWLNGKTLPGATNSSLQIRNVELSHAGSYSVVISNSAGSVNSSTATLIVRLAPMITIQPVSQTATVGANATFGVTAIGTPPLKYQWRFDEADISGATNASLTLSNLKKPNVGEYSVLVRNDFGSVPSAAALLRLFPAFLWALSAGGPSDDEASSVAVDGRGNAFVAGDFLGTANFGNIRLTAHKTTDRDIFVAKYDSAGNVLWVRSAGSNSDDYGRGVATDAGGNCYLTGTVGGLAAFGTSTVTNGGFVAKYDGSGNLFWVKTGGGTAIAADNLGNVYFTENSFIGKLDANGTLVFRSSVATGSGFVFGQSVAVDVVGNSYLTGQLSGQATIGSTLLVSNGGDMFIAKFDGTGKALWARSAGGGQSGQSTIGFGITVDPAGSSYVTGSFRGTARSLSDLGCLSLRKWFKINVPTFCD